MRKPSSCQWLACSVLVPAAVWLTGDAQRTWLFSPESAPALLQRVLARVDRIGAPSAKVQRGGLELMVFAAPAARKRASGELYQHYCAKCHDTDGTGRKNRSATPELPDFTRPKWQAQRTDADLLAAILDGKGKQMPAYTEKIFREEARELVVFLRAFVPALPGRRPSADDLTKQFRKLQEELERLKKESRDLAPRGRP